MKVQGYKQSIFIDKFFFILTLITNSFFWFLILCLLLFVAIRGERWVVDREVVYKLTDG